MALWVRDGSLILKLTMGIGLTVTVLNEETRRPVGSLGGNAILSNSEFSGERDVRDRRGASDRMMVSAFGTLRMIPVIFL